MKNINETIDRAFDAMLDEAAAIVNKEEGEKLVIPDIDVEFSEEHKKKMEKLFRKERQKYRFRTAVTYMPRVACIILIIVAVMAAQSFDGEAWRKKFMNFIFNADAPDTEISFSEEKQSEIYGDMVEFGYMPTGFTIEKSEVSRRHTLLAFCYKDKYFQFKLNDLDVGAALDTESAEAENIEINGCEGIYITKSDKDILVWHDGIYIYRITANIEKSEIIKMAENIKIKK